MQKIRSEGSLLHEISGDYKNFRRDTLLMPLGINGLMLLIGLIFPNGMLVLVLFGLVVTGSILIDTFFLKQMVKFSFNDPNREVTISYYRYLMRNELKINYSDVFYTSTHEYLNRTEGMGLELKIYKDGKLALKLNRKKYGWTDGLVQEVIKSLKFRKIKSKRNV